MHRNPVLRSATVHHSCDFCPKIRISAQTEGFRQMGDSVPDTRLSSLSPQDYPMSSNQSRSTSVPIAHPSNAQDGNKNRHQLGFEPRTTSIGCFIRIVKNPKEV